MSMLAAVMIAAAPAASQGHMARPAVQARATVRILSPVRLRVGSDRSEEGHELRLATIRSEDGSRRTARLVEFE